MANQTDSGRAMSGVLGLCFLVLGAKGFTRGGLSFSAKTRLTGRRARTTGAACLLLGASGIALAYWDGDAAERRRLRTLGQGVVAGVLGAAIVFAHGRLEEGPPYPPEGE